MEPTPAFEAKLVPDQPSFARIFPKRCPAERIGTGFGFTEGPVWDVARKRLIFSDMADDHIRWWSREAGLNTFRRPSNKANGGTFDRQHRLLHCEHSTSRVVRQGSDGTLEVLASHWQGKELNSPNDIVVDSGGAIFFTDPTFGRTREDLGLPRPLILDFRGVYRFCTDSTLSLIADDFDQPNGLCLSLDEKWLFVNDTMRKHIRRFAIADGRASGGEVWADFTGEGIGMPDGMKFDSAGNLYSTGPGGIHVFDPEGERLGIIVLPEKPSNFVWGDADLMSLYVTAVTSVYRVPVLTKGHLTY
jgi:gluconolactonase